MDKQSTGRSMIEMLGVLAIIGVLSIGGLAGYKIAMNYHRANETIHDVMLRATNVPMKWDDYSAKAKDYEFTFADMGAYKEVNPMGYGVSVYSEGPNASSGYAFRVEVSNVPSEVCKRINNMNPVAVDKIEPASANCEVESGILDKMTFYFDENFKGVIPKPETCTPPCGEGKCCQNGSCIDCGNEGCTSCTECEKCVGGNCVADTSKSGNSCGEGKCCQNGSCVDCGNEACDVSQKPDACHKCVEGVWISECSEKCSYCDETSGACKVEPEPDNCSEIQIPEKDMNGCYTGECVCPEGTPTGADETTCTCPANKPVLDNATNTCVACVFDSDCGTENPCMRCVSDEATGEKSCQQQGSLWRNNGTLECCGEGYRSVLTVFSPNPTSEESSYEYALEEINGEKVFVGNSCCPSEENSIPVVHSGWGDTCFSPGIPAANTDGNLSCCGAEQHTCGVQGIEVLGTNYEERLCCDKNDGAYYNVNSGSSLCCAGAQSGGVGPNYVDSVDGYQLARHCCPIASRAYWTGSSVECCVNNPYKIGSDGTHDIYACCVTEGDACTTSEGAAGTCSNDGKCKPTCLCADVSLSFVGQDGTQTKNYEVCCNPANGGCDALKAQLAEDTGSTCEEANFTASDASKCSDDYMSEK